MAAPAFSNSGLSAALAGSEDEAALAACLPNASREAPTLLSLSAAAARVSISLFIWVRIFLNSAGDGSPPDCSAVMSDDFMSSPAFFTDSQISLSLPPPPAASAAGEVGAAAEEAGAAAGADGPGPAAVEVSSSPPQAVRVSRVAQISRVEAVRNRFTGADGSRPRSGPSTRDLRHSASTVGHRRRLVDDR
jgi:hypothetical protein